ncbi:hypothetical protein PRK78_002706 [Emydomyces testavorans]|uniref:Methyltransferase n=1 Tax=Emydomyces testavorans TaxID=2070801 RepID=A0AAF0DEV0_9EURO|nr:hypothetical protein PRK78_002706 [Emydomyces testavorans]
MKYRHENGRRYHSFREGIVEAYFFPNDEVEQDRLDIIHHMTDLIQDGKLYLAPIGDNPQRILDLGTGTGIWAIDMGDMFPSAEVPPILEKGLYPGKKQFELTIAAGSWKRFKPNPAQHGAAKREI